MQFVLYVFLIKYLAVVLSPPAKQSTFPATFLKLPPAFSSQAAACLTRIQTIEGERIRKGSTRFDELEEIGGKVPTIEKVHYIGSSLYES